MIPHVAKYIRKSLEMHRRTKLTKCSIDRSTIYHHHKQITNASTFDDLDCLDMNKKVEWLCTMMIKEGIFIDTPSQVACIF